MTILTTTLHQPQLNCWLTNQGFLNRRLTGSRAASSRSWFVNHALKIAAPAYGLKACSLGCQWPREQMSLTTCAECKIVNKAMADDSAGHGRVHAAQPECCRGYATGHHTWPVINYTPCQEMNEIRCVFYRCLCSCTLISSIQYFMTVFDSHKCSWNFSS